MIGSIEEDIIYANSYRIGSDLSHVTWDDRLKIGTDPQFSVQRHIYNEIHFISYTNKIHTSVEYGRKNFPVIPFQYPMLVPLNQRQGTGKYLVL